MATKKVLQPDSVSFAYKGLSLTIPTGDAIPTDAALAFDEGKGLKFLELLVGPEQWRQVLKVAPTVGDLKSFGDALYEAMDTSVGE